MLETDVFKFNFLKLYILSKRLQSTLNKL